MRLRNVIYLWRNWKYLKRASRIVNEPDAVDIKPTLRNLTEEEIQGLEDLEAVFRLLTTKKLKIEVKHLKPLINKVNV